MTPPGTSDFPYANQAVRDLAFLLYAPAPWRTRHDLPRALLRGDDCDGLLARLDVAPDALLARIAQVRPVRLGLYAELLLAFWFDYAPHIEPVATNRVVREGARTVGEFDFLLRIDGIPWHIETASKFYLQVGNALSTLVGPSLRDAWALKAAKLERQVSLSRHPLAASVLPDGFADCNNGALLAGWFFYASPPVLISPMSSDQLSGWFTGMDQPWPQCGEDSRWLWLPRLRWLSPARAQAGEVLECHVLRARLRDAKAPQLVAEMVEHEGMWREIARGFVVPPGWPDAVRLGQLIEQVKTVAGAP
jgi:hypothetical protein